MRLPLRIRLTAAFGAGMILVLTGFGTFVYVRAGRDLLASVDLDLRARAQIIASSIDKRGSALVSSAGRLIDQDESFAQLLDASGRVVQASSAASSAPLVPSSAAKEVDGPTFYTEKVPRIDNDPLRVLAVPAAAPGHRLVVVVGATLGDRRDALTLLLRSLAIGGPIVVALMSVGTWMVAGAALRPVERMRREAEAVSVSEPSRRLPVPPTGDELARLGTTLNSMLDRLQQAIERERRFVDDASHELRTPLSILKMELDLALDRSRTQVELEEAIRNASQETDRLVRLAEDLLVLAREKRGHLPLLREDVALPELVARTVAACGGRASAAGVRIEVDVPAERASVDPVRVRQALENLLDNSLRHTPPGGVVRVLARRKGDSVSLILEDSGTGFPRTFIDRAFEPFAKSEGAPDQNDAGAGLGLAIVRAIARAHGGQATAENLPGGGARLTLLLRA